MYFRSPHVEMVNLEVFGDARGSLIAVEANQNTPFEIKRMYYIFDTQPDCIRGKHAHKQLRQLLICMHGSVELHCEYQGTTSVFTLNRRDQGLLIEGLVWREMRHFSEGTVLVVLADRNYDESDYIRDYDEFHLVEKQ